jgi:hypothetical protein
VMPSTTCYNFDVSDALRIPDDKRADREPSTRQKILTTVPLLLTAGCFFAIGLHWLNKSRPGVGIGNFLLAAVFLAVVVQRVCALLFQPKRYPHSS